MTMDAYRAGAAAAMAGQIPGSNAGIPARFLPPAGLAGMTDALLGVLDTVALPGINPGQLAVATYSCRLAKHITRLAEALGGAAAPQAGPADGVYRLTVTLPAHLAREAV